MKTQMQDKRTAPRLACYFPDLVEATENHPNQWHPRIGGFVRHVRELDEQLPQDVWQALMPELRLIATFLRGYGGRARERMHRFRILQAAAYYTQNGKTDWLRLAEEESRLRQKDVPVNYLQVVVHRAKKEVLRYIGLERLHIVLEATETLKALGRYYPSGEGWQYVAAGLLTPEQFRAAVHSVWYIRHGVVVVSIPHPYGQRAVTFEDVRGVHTSLTDVTMRWLLAGPPR
jgi:hypothetical protein